MNIQMGKRILVVARKFNDIIYAVNSKEFRNATHKQLLIISNDENLSYPCTDIFDVVIRIHSSNVTWKGQIKLLLEINKIRTKFCCDILFTSNIVLLSHLFIIKTSKCKSIVLLEDGYMNYRNDCFDNNKKKDFVLRLLGINKETCFNLIKATYLLKPESAKYYFGRKKKILLDSKLLPIYNGPDLNNKNIFIGQPLYITNSNINLEKYNEIVNRIIVNYNIDYYIPHLYSSDETIKCPKLRISNWGVTLETVASIYNFNLFSFSSSLLFTTKLINSNIKSTMITHPLVPTIKDIDIFLQSGVAINPALNSRQ